MVIMPVAITSIVFGQRAHSLPDQNANQSDTMNNQTKQPMMEQNPEEARKKAEIALSFGYIWN